MKKTIITLVAMSIILSLSGCGSSTTVKVSIGDQWKTLKTSLLYACIKPNAWQLPDKVSLPKTDINPSDAVPPYSIIDQMTAGSGTANKIKVATEALDLRKDEFVNLIKNSLPGWDMNKVANRAENIANILHITQPFENIFIQPDPILPPGLSIAHFDDKSVYIMIPANVGQQNFDAAYLNALISLELTKKSVDMSRLTQFCQQNVSFLEPEQQFSCDMAYAMSTWLDGTTEPEYRSYLLKSSLTFGHVFTPQVSQWAGNYFQFLGNTTLADVIENAVKDCENPLYQKLYDKLQNPGRLGIVLEDTKDGVRIKSFITDQARETGLLVGDIITDIDANQTKAVWNIQNILFDKYPEQNVIIKIIRKPEMGTAKSLEKLGEQLGMIKLAYELKLTDNSKSGF